MIVNICRSFKSVVRQKTLEFTFRNKFRLHKSESLKGIMWLQAVKGFVVIIGLVNGFIEFTNAETFGKCLISRKKKTTTEDSNFIHQEYVNFCVSFK